MALTLGEAKTKAIQYIKSYSTDGQLTTAGENQDYLLVMNTYAYDALLEIAKKVGITTTYDIVQVGETTEGYNEYALPTNYKEIIRVYLDNKIFFDYQIENGKFIVAKSYDGTFRLLYYKEPNLIDQSTDDDYIFEVKDTYASAIPFYMGGMAVADENKELSDKLLNIYYGKIGEYNKSTDSQPKKVVTVYSI